MVKYSLRNQCGLSHVWLSPGWHFCFKRRDPQVVCLPSKLSDHSTELQAQGGGDHLGAVRADGHHDIVPLAFHLYLPVLNLVQLASL